ncbi:hypothetical protein EDB89DRAFT_1906549 [Lactarius sanguifluus]|nr:hypothetical protein EDB89DRAFT_1906549 [Lactarius sanguifluus]
MCPLLLTAIGLVTVTCFFWAPSFEVGAYSRDLYNLCGLTRCVSAQDAATLKARKGPIKKHGTSKEEIKSASYTRNCFDLSSPCPHHVEGVGILGDGGKWVCGMDAKQEKCVVYSFGIDDKSSFEAALLEPNLKERAHFFPWALGGRNARQNTNEAADKPLSPFSSTMPRSGSCRSSYTRRTTMANPRLVGRARGGRSEIVLDRIKHGVHELQRRREAKTCRVLVYEYPWEYSLVYEVADGADAY